MLVNGFVERQKLTSRELEELRQILDRAKEDVHEH